MKAVTVMVFTSYEAFKKIYESRVNVFIEKQMSDTFCSL